MLHVTGDDLLPIIERWCAAMVLERLKFFNLINSGSGMHGTGYELEIRFHETVISYLSKEGISFGGITTLIRIP